MRLLLLAAALAAPMAVSAQTPVVLTGRVVEVGTEEGVASADIQVTPPGVAVRADEGGRFRIELPGPGRYTIAASRLGYAARDTTITVREDRHVLIRLATRPVDIEPIAARVIRPAYARSGRELFEAEVRTGLVGVSRTEIAEMPSIGEVDVLRALQALPSVITVNDLASTLHVMGGGPDQNVFLWDGARVFAPYHMFGILGAFPSGSIDGIEFYRGAVPARYDDALSSVVDIKQGARDTAFFGDVSLSTLAAGATVGGLLPLADGEGDWVLGARRTHLDRLLLSLVDREFPYAFYDVNGRLTWAPDPAHHVQLSFLVTDDRFAAPQDEREVEGQLDLRTAWSNQVVSGSWQWAGDGPWSSRLAGSWSGYRGELEVGDYRGDYTTTDALGIGTVEFQLRRRFGAHAVQVGASGQGGRVRLTGDSGGYVEADRDATVLTAGGFAEAELVLGRLTVVPALRVDLDVPRTLLLVQPRATARFEATDDWSISVGAGRTAQRLHALRDERTVLPGAPLWIAPADDEPASTADALTLETTRWFGDRWSMEAGGYARWFRNVPVWFPEGSRALTGFRFDDGRAAGLELLIRRHGEGLTGWLAYGLATVEYENSETGRGYSPPWDRRHSVDAAASVPLPWGMRATARAGYATGNPFWPFGGNQVIARLTTATGQLFWDGTDLAPYWSRDQMRMPPYFRLDLSLRAKFELWGARFVPSAGILNVTARPNVLYYRPQYATSQFPLGQRPPLIPETSSQTNRIPSIGLNIYF